MTASTVACCDCCGTEAPAAEIFEPYRGAARCRDAGACEQRQIVQFDPSLALTMDDRPEPPPADATPGAACDACQAIAPPGGLYNRGPSWRCLDRGGCEERRLLPDLAPVSEDFPELGQSFTGAAFRGHASSPEVGADPVPLGHAEIVALAVQDAAWRKR